MCVISYVLLYNHSFALSFPLWQKEKEVNDKKEDKKAKAKAEESEENQSENGETKTNEVYMYIHNSLPQISVFHT